MTKRSAKIFLYTVAAIVTLIGATALFTQTPMFRATVRSTLYTFLEDELNAAIYIGEINGNLFTEFSVDTMMMYVDGAPFLETGKISVQYDLFDLLGGKITVDTVTIENPFVTLIGLTNGEWNVDHLSKSPPSDDTTESALSVTAGIVQIRNGKFRLTDSSGSYDHQMVDRNGRRVINYSNFAVEQIDIDLKGRYSAKELAVDIDRLSLFSSGESFSIEKFSTSVIKTDNYATIKNLKISSPSSSIDLTARIDGIDAFSITDMEELRKVQVSLFLQPSNVLSSDIQLFLPSLDFLHGNVYLDGEMEGNFENLNVRTLHTRFAKTEITLSGTVSNLYKPKELRLNIVSTNSAVNPSDIPALLPYYSIPNYQTLGMVTFDFQFVGKPLDFLAISKIKSAAGTVTVDGEMVITEENIHYKGILAGNNVNLEKVFASDEFLSRLNTRVFIEGVGTTLATLNSEATIEIDSSMFRHISIDKAKVEIAAKDKKVETTVSIHSPKGVIGASAAADFQSEELPAYHVTASVRDLDLAPILNDDYYQTNLSFDVERWGEGLTLFDNASETTIDFTRSNFRGMTFDSAKVVLQWLKDSTNQDRIVIQSPVVDGSLSGRFTFDDIVKNIQTHLHGFESIYKYQRSIVDSSYSLASDSLIISDSIGFHPSMVLYNLALKNLTPISHVFDFPLLDIVGNVRGTIRSDTDGVSSEGDISVTNGSYADSNTPVMLRGVQVNYSVKNLVPNRLITKNDSIAMDLKISGSRVGIGNTQFRAANGDFHFEKQHGKFSFASDIDTTFTVFTNGMVDVAENSDRVTFSELYTKYQGIDLQAKQPFIATISAEGISVDSALFIRRDEEIFVKGKYDYHGEIVADASVTNFDLSDIFFVSTSESFREQALALGGTVDMSAKITGTVENPRIIAQLEGNDISYRNSSFGDLNAALNYSQKMAALKVEMIDTANTTALQKFNLEGVVPIDLSFVSVEDRLNRDGMDVQLTTNGLSNSIFDVFIPEIDHMHGGISGKIDILGSLVEPRLAGTLQLDSGSFRLEMNDINYLVGGTIRLDSQKIMFPDFALSNQEEDYNQGRAVIGGYIQLKGFAPSEYHLTANGELLVLHDRSRTANQSFFGRLIGQTGPAGIRFEGSFERSRLIGNIIVQDAFLTFPPTQQAISLAAARFDEIFYIDDTSKQMLDTTIAVDVAPTLLPAPSQKVRERTFLDGFGYELTIETKSNVRVQMIFNANAGAYEELFAELNGKMVLKKDEAGQQLTGTINVGDGSNYEFYKKFKATGSLTFIGDPQNPQLNIIAKYEGTHLKDPNDNTTEERVVVSLEITGSRLNPKIKIGLATLDQSGREIPRQGDVENDAIAFLLTSSQNEPGLFREELAQVDRNKLGSQLNEAISGTFINNLLSGLVMDFVTQNNIPWVKRIEVRNVTSETDINTILEVSDAVINIGGKVFTDVSNTNVSVQLPVLGKQNRNFIFEVEKKTENADYTSVQTKNILGARLFYRFTF